MIALPTFKKKGNRSTCSSYRSLQLFHTITAILTLFFLPIALSGQSLTCDPVTLVGFWEEEPDLLTALMLGKRGMAFLEDGTVETYIYNAETDSFDPVGTGKYNLDHPHFPKYLTLSDLSISIFQTSGSISLELLSLNDFGFSFKDILGMPVSYKRVYPEPERYSYGFASKEDLLQEVLKRPNAPSEVFSYLSEPLLPETRTQISNLLSAIPTRNIYYTLLKELASFSFKWMNSNEQQVSFNYLKSFSNELCAEVEAFEIKKKEHWEIRERARLLYPETYKDPAYHKEMDKEYYALIDEQSRLESIRRSALVEIGILKAANPDF